ncbi:hypothetical protein PUATCC27989T_00917 [Phytobacter ursingii]|nr:hypothetical protein PUATCC27989T_00917 [Phytobacter ursingii]
MIVMQYRFTPPSGLQVRCPIVEGERSPHKNASTIGPLSLRERARVRGKMRLGRWVPFTVCSWRNVTPEHVNG